MLSNGLAVAAHYYAQMDGVEVEWSLVLVGDVVAPTNIKSAQATLYKGDTALQQTDVLTKFHANEDFAFRTIFLHPLATTGMTVEAHIITRDGVEYKKKVNVVPGEITGAENTFGANEANLVDK